MAQVRCGRDRVLVLGDLLVLLLQPLGQGIKLLLVNEQRVALLDDIVKVRLHLAILLAP